MKEKKIEKSLHPTKSLKSKPISTYVGKEPMVSVRYCIVIIIII